MPLYGVAQSGYHQTAATAGLNITALIPGDIYTLFNAETPTAGTGATACSISVAFASSGPVAKPATFTATWGTGPSAAQVDIQAANQDVDADYQVVGSITTFPGSYADQGAYAYYRARLTSNTGGSNLTVIVQR